MSMSRNCSTMLCRVQAQRALMLRGHAEPDQGSSPAETRATDAAHEVVEQYHGRRTRSRHHAGHAASVAAVEGQADDDQNHGRRSARLQVKGEQKQHEDLQQQQHQERPRQAASSGPAHPVSSRTSRALARNARLVENDQATWDWTVPTGEHMAAEENVQADLLRESVTAPTARRTRAQHRSSMPEHSRLSTPEPPEQASDVHNTGHALRRSHRQHARSPSVAGPTHIDSPEEAPQAASSGIRVTLRTLRHATRQGVHVHPASNDSEVPPRRHKLRSSLRARQ